MAAVGRIGRALRRVGGPDKAAPAKLSPPAAKAAAGNSATVHAQVTRNGPTSSPVKKAAPAKGAPVTKAAPARRATTAKQTPTAKQPSPGKKTAAAKKAPANGSPAKTSAPAKTDATVQKAAGARANPVTRESEWSRAELAAVRKALVAEVTEMRNAYERSLRDLDDLQKSSTDGAGDDQADAGSKTFEREQEQSIAANRLDLLTQIQRAVERIDAGTYGFCESCGKPIPKARLKAFPGATLDVACKQREERR